MVSGHGWEHRLWLPQIPYSKVEAVPRSFSFIKAKEVINIHV